GAGCSSWRPSLCGVASRGITPRTAPAPPHPNGRSRLTERRTPRCPTVALPFGHGRAQWAAGPGPGDVVALGAVVPRLPAEPALRGLVRRAAHGIRRHRGHGRPMGVALARRCAPGRARLLPLPVALAGHRGRL